MKDPAIKLSVVLKSLKTIHTIKLKQNKIELQMFTLKPHPH